MKHDCTDAAGRAIQEQLPRMPEARATHGAVAGEFCWSEGKSWLELDVKKGNDQARTMELIKSW